MAVNIRPSPRGASSQTSVCHLQLTYKANTGQMLHQYTMTKDEPLFRQAKANADLLSAVSSGNLIPVGKGTLLIQTNITANRMVRNSN